MQSFVYSCVITGWPNLVGESRSRRKTANSHTSEGKFLLVVSGQAKAFQLGSRSSRLRPCYSHPCLWKYHSRALFSLDMAEILRETENPGQQTYQIAVSPLLRSKQALFDYS